MQAVTITQITTAELELLIENALKRVLSTPTQANQQTEELLTIQDAADFLKLTVPTLYGLVSRSRLPVNKRGKRLYFSKAELTAWIKEGRKKTIAETERDADVYMNRKAKQNGK